VTLWIAVIQHGHKFRTLFYYTYEKQAHANLYKRIYIRILKMICRFTVTIENAAKHIAASKIRKWPHRLILKASSSCCMNLKMKTNLQWSHRGRNVLHITKCILIIWLYIVHVFLLNIRRQFRQTGFIMVIVLLSEVRIVNDVLIIPF